ncbi:MAG TPA: tripartite tricarboxylate transporter permease, partial [Anaerovoracaceae bacterium]|nr:tripartite tricarboxylate transporter permease [Anaerovoracaceae bacterium]
MDLNILQNLALGFSQVLSITYILFITIGVAIGLLVGALPGLGPTAAICILLPLTYNSDPVLSLVMLTGIYYGAMFGGAYTSIMLNLPGENSAVMTAEQGYKLACHGKASEAIQMSNIASFIGGTFSIILLTFTAAWIGSVALKFGAPEYTILMLLGLSAVAFVGSGPASKGLMSVVFGLMVGTVGSEPITGAQRFTFHNYNLGDGIPFAAVAMGLFAISEVFLCMEKHEHTPIITGKEKRLKIKWPSKEDNKISAVPTLIGSVVGFVLGVLPGVGPTIASFMSYGIVRGRTKDPKKWETTGAIEGIAATEAANNSSVGGCMVPMLSLGIPGSSATAVLMAGLMVHGIRPGPLLFANNPEVPWGVISSMYIGNVIAVVLGVLTSVYIVHMLRLPPVTIYTTILVITMIGAFSVNNGVFNIYVLIVFGIIGYFFEKVKVPKAPCVLGLVLGPSLETSFSQSLIMSHGSLTIYLQRPVSLGLLVLLL